jgi:hypothetical protein
MRVITLIDQLEWCVTCLDKMKRSGRPASEVYLQESVVLTIKDRIRDKDLLKNGGNPL